MNVAGHNILSVSQVISQVKYSLEKNYSNVWIKGEVSYCKPYSSGHIYLTLKDNSTELSAVIFSQYAHNITCNPTPGMEVLVMGDLSIYAPRGQFQLQVKNLYLSGEGELWLAFETLKKKLEAEGMFDLAVKKKIPLYPKKIGIITSSEGAALQDIIHVLNRRAPHIKCYIHPVPVQGYQAADKIAEAIENMNRHGKVDLLIVGRGGGSLEDLWSFNEEIVVRSIYNSQIPIISAIGHETDSTLSDYAADYRAPTPSAAAEVAALNREEILQHLDHLQESFIFRVNHLLKSYSEKINTLQKRYGFQKPQMILNNWNEKLADKYRQLNQSLTNCIQIKVNRMASISSKLELLNPQFQLQRGYALAVDKNQKVIYHPEQVEIDDIFQLRFAKGQLTAKVLDKGNNNGTKKDI